MNFVICIHLTNHNPGPDSACLHPLCFTDRTYSVGCFGSDVFYSELYLRGASQLLLVVKSPPTCSGVIRDVGSIPGSERSPGGGHGNPHEYSCLENPH